MRWTCAKGQGKRKRRSSWVRLCKGQMGFRAFGAHVLDPCLGNLLKPFTSSKPAASWLQVAGEQMAQETQRVRKQTSVKKGQIDQKTENLLNPQGFQRESFHPSSQSFLDDSNWASPVSQEARESSERKKPFKQCRVSKTVYVCLCSLLKFLFFFLIILEAPHFENLWVIPKSSQILSCLWENFCHDLFLNMDVTARWRQIQITWVWGFEIQRHGSSWGWCIS